MKYFELSNIEIKKMNEIKKSVILVTGGTGFLGKWAIEFVKYLNDVHSFGISLHLLARNISSELSGTLKKRDDIFFIQKDIRNLSEIPENVNFIIHAACSPDNIQHMSNPIETMDIISNGTKQLLENALTLPNLKKIINLSSGQVYGNVGKDKVSEKDMGVLYSNSIKSIYAESKRFSETLSKSYESLYKLPIVQVRPFSFIGPFMSLDKPWAINNFIYDALKFKKIKIIGNGKPVRSYMYPTDMIEWLFNILVNSRNGFSYNLGSDEKISLEELATVIKNKIGNNISVEIQSMNREESVFLPDLSFIKQELGVSLKINFETAIEQTIKWNSKK